MGSRVDKVEAMVAPVVASLKAIEQDLSSTVAKEKFALGGERELDKRRDMQIGVNYLENELRRVVAARQILDQSGVLICQDGKDILVVTQIDQRTVDLVRVAEQNGAQIIGIERIESEEAKAAKAVAAKAAQSLEKLGIASVGSQGSDDEF